MAEAHAAVAFSFTVTPDGYDVNINHDAIRAVWESGMLSWKKRMGKLKNNILNGVFPASPTSWLFVVTLVLGLRLAGVDPSFGMIAYLQENTPFVKSMSYSVSLYISTILFGTITWICKWLILKYLLKLLLTYHNWIYEVRGKMSLKTKLWFVLIRLYGGRKPLLMSYQASLPKLPVPSIKSSITNYLLSVKPLMTDEQYAEMEQLSKDFNNGIGNRLQRYLVLKSWWATNYVTDWWEQYVYLRGRSPLMVNSNYYGLDAILVTNTTVQTARAANLIYAMLMYRREIDREELNPILINGHVPLCSAQYERQFNTCRIPGVETDNIVHFADSNHVTVYHKGRYYKVYIRHKGRILKPCEIEVMMQKIIDDDSAPADGEEHLAAMTAGERIPWAKARKEFFSKGKNKASLDAIEKAAFCVSLDTENYDYDPNDPSELDRYGKAMLHGSGYDRWFDKSFTFVIAANGRIGFNAEHSWADAPIMAHMWEWVVSEESLFIGGDAPIMSQQWEAMFSMSADELRADAPLMAQTWETISQREIDEFGADAPIMAQVWETIQQDEHILGYDKDGHTRGTPENYPPNPIRLEWDMSKPCQQAIQNSLQVSRALLNDVDLNVLMFTTFGKGLVKTFKLSPDAFLQAAIQLTYFRMERHFCLTYESSMTRLFREGRTETVRSCTTDTCAFVRAVDEGKPSDECIKLLRKAADTHQRLYRDTMTGSGVDRHLFCLYVVSKYLNTDSPFLTKVLSDPWKLSTSQTPHQQTDRLDLNKHPDRICAGGGFGPVADDGYGVSYMIAGEDTIFFHISSKVSCEHTDSHKYGDTLRQSLCDMRDLFQASS